MAFYTEQPYVNTKLGDLCIRPQKQAVALQVLHSSKVVASLVGAV